MSYRANHPTVELRETDIRYIEPDELRASLGLKRAALTLLKACPPCQGYSSIGKGDPADPRNDLVAEVWRFAREFRPRVVMLGIGVFVLERIARDGVERETDRIDLNARVEVLNRV
jgi:site-specific DNA-cytosine methylase